MKVLKNPILVQDWYDFLKIIQHELVYQIIDS